MPAVERQSPTHAIILGGLLGLVAYAGYDLTGLVTLDGFPLSVELVDLVLGTVLGARDSAISFLVSTYLI